MTTLVVPSSASLLKDENDPPLSTPSPPSAALIVNSTTPATTNDQQQQQHEEEQQTVVDAQADFSQFKDSAENIAAPVELADGKVAMEATPKVVDEVVTVESSAANEEQQAESSTRALDESLDKQGSTDAAADSKTTNLVPINEERVEQTTTPTTNATPTIGDTNTNQQDDQTHPPTNNKDNKDDDKRFVSPKDFDLLKVIGMGAFGKVLQVRNKETKSVLAMKVISKRVLNRKSGYVENVRAERDILTRVRSPFVVTMHCSFQTREKLFIVMDFLAGGELFLRIGREGIFLQKTAAFYLGEIILALDHLHTLGILHRDLKPENILLGSDGHVCLTDFGLAKDFGGFETEEDDSRALTICGTQVCRDLEENRIGFGSEQFSHFPFCFHDFFLHSGVHGSRNGWTKRVRPRSRLLESWVHCIRNAVRVASLPAQTQRRVEGSLPQDHVGKGEDAIWDIGGSV